MSSWVLCYWVRGRPLDALMTVKVSPETTIDEFKDRIIELNALSPRPSIHVYKVPDDTPVPDDDSMEDILGGLSISMLGKPLRATRQLSSCFTSPIPDGQLHLIIDVLEVHCWRRGVDRATSFMIRVSVLEEVNLFRNAIKAEQHAILADVPMDSLKLYKISATDDNLAEILRTTGAGQLLDDGGQHLGTVFSDIPFSQNPGVIIEWLDESRGPALKRRASEDLIEFVKRAKLVTQAPSIISKPSVFRDLCQDAENRIMDHRHLYMEHPSGEPSYPDDELPPISLRYAGFGRFLDIFSGREDVPGMEHLSSAGLISAVDDFADLMSQVFPDEFTRRDTGIIALNTIFSSLPHSPGKFMAAAVRQSITTDAHVLGSHNAACCVIEFKNEQGDVSSIPYVQMCSHFAHSLRAGLMYPDLANLMKGWNIPCLGLTIVGPCIMFYAIIYSGQWQVVSITPALSCISESGQGADRILLHAAFKAASVFFAHIENDITRLLRNPPEIGVNRCLPYISSLSHPRSLARIQFKIHSRIFHDKTTNRELYLARTIDDDKLILVKFSRCYSLELHAFCADRGCAPALVGFEKLPGGFFCTAMEFVESACQLTQSPHVEKHREWVAQLWELVRSFHHRDLVHGDLRSPNIICDGNRIMLIDFDWAGKSGEASYPDALLNPDLTDGRDSSDRKITKDDDLRVLDRTLKSVQLGM